MLKTVVKKKCVDLCDFEIIGKKKLCKTEKKYGIPVIFFFYLSNDIFQRVKNDGAIRDFRSNVVLKL